MPRSFSMLRLRASNQTSWPRRRALGLLRPQSKRRSKGPRIYGLDDRSIVLGPPQAGAQKKASLPHEHIPNELDYFMAV